jgi:methyltransferase (TIGR00027 family)
VPPHVTLVPVDLDHQDLRAALQQAGYSGGEPTFFVWEGVTQYLTEAAVRKTFEFFRSASRGSQLVFTYIRQDFLEGRRKYGLETLHRQAVVKSRLWQFGWEPDAIGGFLDEYAWTEVEQAGSTDYQARYLAPVNRALLVMEVERAVLARNATHLQSAPHPAHTHTHGPPTSLPRAPIHSG